MMLSYLQFELHYDVQKNLPFIGVFCLIKSEKVSIQKTNSIKAIALLQKVVNQALGLPDPSIDPKAVGEMRINRLKNLTQFVQKVPTYELRLNTTDPFWEEIESLLFDEAQSV